MKMFIEYYTQKERYKFDYERVKQKIQAMLSNRQLFHYNRLGLIFCFLHIPFKRTQHYFCSQFVAELLSLKEDITLTTPFFISAESVCKRNGRAAQSVQGHSGYDLIIQRTIKQEVNKHIRCNAAGLSTVLQTRRS